MDLYLPSVKRAVISCSFILGIFFLEWDLNGEEIMESRVLISYGKSAAYPEH